MTFPKQNWFKLTIIITSGAFFIFVASMSNNLGLYKLFSLTQGPVSFTSTPTISDNLQKKLILPKKVVWAGEVVTGMTYGRLWLKKLAVDDAYPEFVIEPRDMIVDGALRYSPTTRDIEIGQVLRVTGEWESMLDGIPWILIEKIEPL